MFLVSEAVNPHNTNAVINFVPIANVVYGNWLITILGVGFVICLILEVGLIAPLICVPPCYEM